MSPVSRLNQNFETLRKGVQPMLRRKPKETGPVSWIRKKIIKCKRLTWGCRIAIFGAGAFSIWANVLHARPGTVPLVIAAAPPLLVLAGWEMVSRVPLRADTGWFKRFVRPTATGLIAAGAAWLSYWYQRGAVIMYSGDEQTGSILPGLVDGLMVIASVTVMELNLMVADLEAREHGQQVLRTTPPGTPVKTMRTVTSAIRNT